MKCEISLLSLDSRYFRSVALKGELKLKRQLFFFGRLFSKYHVLVIKKTRKSLHSSGKALNLPKIRGCFFQFERPPFCVLFLPVTSKKGMPPATFWRHCSQPIQLFQWEFSVTRQMYILESFACYLFVS